MYTGFRHAICFSRSLTPAFFVTTTGEMLPSTRLVQRCALYGGDRHHNTSHAEIPIFHNMTRGRPSEGYDDRSRSRYIETGAAMSDAVRSAISDGFGTPYISSGERIWRWQGCGTYCSRQWWTLALHCRLDSQLIVPRSAAP